MVLGYGRDIFLRFAMWNVKIFGDDVRERELLRLDEVHPGIRVPSSFGGVHPRVGVSGFLVHGSEPAITERLGISSSSSVLFQGEPGVGVSGALVSLKGEMGVIWGC